jgi:hypothetical protein
LFDTAGGVPTVVVVNPCNLLEPGGNPDEITQNRFLIYVRLAYSPA